MNRFLAMAAAGCFLASSAMAEAPKFELRKNDHIAIIGNTVADRMQHYGWLETLIANHFSDLDLTFRDLAVNADELTVRLRSFGFGTPDEWLAREKADVVFAFFGSNESWQGEKGLAKFKSDLDKFIKSTEGQKYNGTSAPRLVVFSPIAHEDLHNPNLPDGKAHNELLKMYTAAMKEVCDADNVTFVDLFAPTLELYSKSEKPITQNGIHQSEAGDAPLAALIFDQLFHVPSVGKFEKGDLEKLRQAVLDKDWHWFERYRVLDGYNVYGKRADESYVDAANPAKKLTNRVVMDREMEVLEVMTANRDKHIWSMLHGKEEAVDDSNTPPFIPVPTNMPGKGPDGQHIYRSGEDAIKHIKLAPHLKINLFASEEKFPDLIEPVQMAWDTKGRLWVATWPSYPHWQPKTPMADKICIFEDTDGDGVADKETVFADHLHCPTGFEFYNGGIILAQAPDIVFLKDTDGDDKADVHEILLSGMDSADSHHTANSFTFDPGGALYFQEGTFMRTQVETPWGPPERCADGGVYRFEPKTDKFEAYFSFGFANPHGHAFNRWGTDIVMDGTGADPYFAPAATGKVYYPQKHSGAAPKLYKQRTRPCPGIEFVSSPAFPDDWQQDLLVANVITIQGIMRYHLADAGSAMMGKEAEVVLQSDDLNFHPADMEFGPDGALYFLDWQNAIIGHLQHHLRDPSRDHTHGRIYRVTYEGRDLVKPAKIAGEPIANLLELLKSPQDRVAYRAKIELSSHDSKDVMAALDKWIAGLDKNDADYQHQMMEALWVRQWNNVVDEPLLKTMLRSPDERARTAATRVLCYWRDSVPDALDLLQVQVADDSPRVRLEAVRACSFFKTPKAGEVALEALNKPTDKALKYTLDETMKTLDKVSKEK